jgi:hypothetical protein
MPETRHAALHGDRLDEAFDALERATPDFIARAIRRLRKPSARIVRLPLGILCLVAAFLWFLPVLGIWLLPLGLLLIAQDVPLLRRPVGRATLYVLGRWQRLRAWWRARHAGRERGGTAPRPAEIRTRDPRRSRNGARKNRTAGRS